MLQGLFLFYECISRSKVKPTSAEVLAVLACKKKNIFDVVVMNSAEVYL